MYNIDIFASDRVLDFATALAAREFSKNSVAGRNTEKLADSFCELRVRVTSQDNNVAHHGDGEVVRLSRDGGGRRLEQQKVLTAAKDGSGKRVWRGPESEG